MNAREPAAGRGLSTAVLLAGAAATGWAAIFVRLADEAEPLAIAAYRLLIAAAVMVAIAAVRVAAGRDALPARRNWPLLALGGAFLAGHFWSWFASLQLTAVGSSVAIVAMQPLLAAGLAYLFLGERPAGSEYLGIALAAVGLAVIGAGDLAGGPEVLGGDALALLGGLLAAAYHTAGRALRPAMSAWTYSASVYGVAAAVLWLLVAGFRPPIGGYAGGTWTFIVLLALVPQLIGHTAFNWALAHVRVVTVSLALVAEPVIATLLAVPVLGERPPAAVLIGGPFILAGVAIGLRGGAVAGEAAKPLVGSGQPG